jgi:hypothetical protein
MSIRMSRHKKAGKIVFCFLLTKDIKHVDIWNKFFTEVPKSMYSVYSHIKKNDGQVPDYIKKNKIDTINTEWCTDSLVTAFINMIKHGLKDPDNKYFILVSGECVPLYTFSTMRQKIFKEPRSILDIIKFDDGHYYNSQWMIISRSLAHMFIKMPVYYNKFKHLDIHCPDETYPVYYLLDILGNSFDKHVINKPVTYTVWKKGIPHPLRLRKKDIVLNNICDSGALFSRKYYKNSVDDVAMRCR